MNWAAQLEADLGLSHVMDVEQRIAALKTAARHLELAYPHELRAHVVVAAGVNRRIVTAVLRWPGVVVVSDNMGRVIARSLPGQPGKFDYSVLQ